MNTRKILAFDVYVNEDSGQVTVLNDTPFFFGMPYAIRKLYIKLQYSWGDVYVRGLQNKKECHDWYCLYAYMLRSGKVEKTSLRGIR